MADAKKRNPAKPEFPPKLSTIHYPLSTVNDLPAGVSSKILILH